MAHQAELDVNDYGSVDTDDDGLPVNTIDHDWYTPYPLVDKEIVFTWEPGDTKRQPGVFWYPLVRDWVCDKPTYELLMRLAPGDIHLFARGRLGTEELFLVQVVTMLDIVDKEKSIIEDHGSYEILEFPAFHRDKASLTQGRIFRIPESFPEIYLGDDIKEALEAAGVKGLRFVKIDWSDEVEER